MSLVLHTLVVSRKAPLFILIAGGFLAWTGLLGILEALSERAWRLWGWPLLPVGISIGMLEYYLAVRKRDRSALTAALVMGLLSVASLIINGLLHAGVHVIAMLFMALGALIIVINNKNR
ncbi:hypothetical protein [Paenibacillus swuensis]|uniref:hypothetical protein n=1 Tax=Paenibacillus swuensis TaxID=1178515 RepID=UPI0018D4C7C0|nr:hypothetical protein [Paenibacillus swuensis]